MPSLAEALSDVHVVNALTQAWNQTQATGHEYGGWIHHNGGVGMALQYGVRQKTSHQATSIVLTLPADLQWFTDNNRVILADFHCHPGGVGNIAGGRPSDADIQNANGLPYGRLVFTSDTNHLYNIKPLPAPSPNGFPADTIMWYVR